MAIRKILRLGNPVLREKARELCREEIVSPKVQALIEDMVETMRGAEGLGLAAPQIGVGVRLALVEIPENPKRYPGMKPYPFGIYINPKVKVLDREMQGFWEGCLSIPGLRGFVERPRKIEVSYFDRGGNPISMEVEGFPATVFQHEFDHLDGKLFVDRVKDTKRIAFLDEFHEFHDPVRGQPSDEKI